MESRGDDFGEDGFHTPRSTWTVGADATLSVPGMLLLEVREYDLAERREKEKRDLILVVVSLPRSRGWSNG
jgi:hypothetical protein